MCGGGGALTFIDVATKHTVGVAFTSENTCLHVQANLSKKDV